MNESQDKQNNLIETTDCLEAIEVFKGWKNFLFVIVLLCLLLLQISFWLVNTGFVKTGDEAKSDSPAAIAEDTEKAAEAATQTAKETDKIKKAAEEVAGDTNQPAEAIVQEPQRQAGPRFDIKVEHLTWLIRFLNFVLVLAAILYCLTMLFSLKVSLLGRLGGINHITRAFFLSLAFLVFLLPWHLPWKVYFGRVVVLGAIYTPEELLSWYAGEDEIGIFGEIFYYLRFTGYWVLVLLLLIFSQLRSCRWAKAILRRLEVI